MTSSKPLLRLIPRPMPPRVEVADTPERYIAGAMRQLEFALKNMARGNIPGAQLHIIACEWLLDEAMLVRLGGIPQ